MWLFFKNGFVSVVQHRDKPKRVLVRARRRQDLVAVVNVWSQLFGKKGRAPKIQVDSKADYTYRLNMDKAEWSKVVMSIANQIDYDNFKNSIEDGCLLSFAHHVWDAGQDYLGIDRYDQERIFEQNEGTYVS